MHIMRRTPLLAVSAIAIALVLQLRSDAGQDNTRDRRVRCSTSTRRRSRSPRIACDREPCACDAPDGVTVSVDIYRPDRQTFPLDPDQDAVQQQHRSGGRAGQPDPERGYVMIQADVRASSIRPATSIRSRTSRTMASTPTSGSRSSHGSITSSARWAGCTWVPRSGARRFANKTLAAMAATVTTPDTYGNSDAPRAALNYAFACRHGERCRFHGLVPQSTGAEPPAVRSPHAAHRRARPRRQDIVRRTIATGLPHPTRDAHCKLLSHEEQGLQ